MHLNIFAPDHKAAALACQRIQGILFLLMGGAVLLLPGLTIPFSVHNPPKQDLFRIVWQCFGSQACLAGLLLSTSTMDRRAFLLWTAAMVPYIAFDGYCLWGRPGEYATPRGVAGDFAGNFVFVVLSLYAAARLKEAEEEEKKKGGKRA